MKQNKVSLKKWFHCLNVEQKHKKIKVRFKHAEDGERYDPPEKLSKKQLDEKCLEHKGKGRTLP